MEGSPVSPARGLPRFVRFAFTPLTVALSLALGASLLAMGCASTEPAGESLHGQIVDSRTMLGYGDIRYMVTVECHEATGAFSRLTLEVNQEEWMRFHTAGQEVCVLRGLGLYRLSRCN